MQILGTVYMRKSIPSTLVQNDKSSVAWNLLVHPKQSLQLGPFCLFVAKCYLDSRQCWPWAAFFTTCKLCRLVLKGLFRVSVNLQLSQREQDIIFACVNTVHVVCDNHSVKTSLAPSVPSQWMWFGKYHLIFHWVIQCDSAWRLPLTGLSWLPSMFTYTVRLPQTLQEPFADTSTYLLAMSLVLRLTNFM